MPSGVEPDARALIVRKQVCAEFWLDQFERAVPLGFLFRVITVFHPSEDSRPIASRGSRMQLFIVKCVSDLR